jgi:uncharacterized protein (TIGR04255 family)
LYNNNINDLIWEINFLVDEMARQRHLKNAPIKESVIDFRISPPNNNIDLLSSLTKDITSSYPLTDPIKNFTGSFGVVEGKPFVKPPEDKIDGYSVKSGDGKNIAQFKVNGFTFSRLAPYTQWEIVRDEAKILWELYSTKMKPELITRVAVRYINLLIFNSPLELDEYFTESIKLPKSLPQEFYSFFQRIVVPQEDLMANIIQTTQNLQDNNKLGIILDIDVYKLDESGIDRNKLWEIFERLRDFKNRIFFEIIQEKTAEMYE